MREKERTKVVVDDTTIYEIDLECYECKNKEAKEEKETAFSERDL